MRCLTQPWSGGEGRWTIKAAIDEGVPADVLSSALYECFSSRGQVDFADKLLLAMCYEFGGISRNGRVVADRGAGAGLESG
jgi:6-phosphogluconate dehydrogenase (decarboxylating)